MRIGVVSDVHANLPALEAVVAAVGQVDAWWHLGDVVGYGPHPDEVVDRLRELGALGIRGNHDAAASGAIEPDWFNHDARWAIEWTARRISAATRDWLTALPEVREAEGATLVHGSLRDPTWEYVLGPEEAVPNLSALTTPYLLHGHTHVPVAWRAGVPGRVELLRMSAGGELALDDRRVLLNPGSVGQPRDRDPRASAMLLDTTARRATWLRIPYPVATVQADMRATGHPDWLVRRLAAGT